MANAEFVKNRSLYDTYLLTVMYHYVNVTLYVYVTCLIATSLLRRDHTLSSDLPLMRFFFISPQQKISSLHTGNETDSEFEVFSKRMTF